MHLPRGEQSISSQARIKSDTWLSCGQTGPRSHADPIGNLDGGWDRPDLACQSKVWQRGSAISLFYWTVVHLIPRSSYLDRKSTRLNSSHSQISYAVFCLKKKKIQ